MIRNKQSRLFRKLPLVAAIGMASLASMAVQQASAHGYIESPKSRAFMCQEHQGALNRDCGSVQYEPQSIEFPGRPGGSIRHFQGRAEPAPEISINAAQLMAPSRLAVWTSSRH